MSNSKSLLGEWSQSRGHGPFQSSFQLTFDVVGEQRFCARLLRLATGLEVRGAPSVGKKTTERHACDQMYKHVMTPPDLWPSLGSSKSCSVPTQALANTNDKFHSTTTDSKSLIGEWSQARGEGSFTIAFALSFQQCGEQRFRAVLRHRASGHVTCGTETLGKRETEQQACDNMHGHLRTVAAASAVRRADPKSLLGEWSQSRGLGPFAMVTSQLDEQVYRATLTHSASGHSVVGARTIGKKGSELAACQGMHDHLTATSDLRPPVDVFIDYRARLDEWIEHRGLGPFQDNFSLTFGLLGEQQYRARVVHLDTGHEILAEPSIGKRATEQAACKLMYEYVDTLGGGQPRRRDVRLGEMVLSLCLALAGGVPSEMSDEVLAGRAKYCSGLVLSVEGRTVRQDADEVRRHVFELFMSNGQDIAKTRAHLRTLLNWR